MMNTFSILNLSFLLKQTVPSLHVLTLLAIVYLLYNATLLHSVIGIFVLVTEYLKKNFISTGKT